MLAFAPTANTQAPGCTMTFAGTDRKKVKNRKPRQTDYTFVNGGRSISVPEWFTFVCGLDPDAPTRSADVPQIVAMDVEAYRVKVRAFILAVRREPDNDLHVQTGETADWNQQQLIVEVRLGRHSVRTALVDMMTADGWNGRSRDYIFNSPSKADMTDNVFLDSAHMPADARRSDWCVQNGGRGINTGLMRTPVRGIWELHPVFKIEPVQ